MSPATIGRDHAIAGIDSQHKLLRILASHLGEPIWLAQGPRADDDSSQSEIEQLFNSFLVAHTATDLARHTGFRHDTRIAG